MYVTLGHQSRPVVYITVNNIEFNNNFILNKVVEDFYNFLLLNAATNISNFCEKYKIAKFSTRNY